MFNDWVLLCSQLYIELGSFGLKQRRHVEVLKEMLIIRHLGNE